MLCYMLHIKFTPSSYWTDETELKQMQSRKVKMWIPSIFKIASSYFLLKSWLNKTRIDSQPINEATEYEEVFYSSW